ncbi:MAG: hypothetical protein HZB37_10395 [Planctomycetes bacterium]|nr:hypothetical protein [Planctomycetota bacterium]
MKEIIASIIIPGIAVLGAAVGGAITIYVYYCNSQLRRAEWLYSLFEKFFYQSQYSDIRRLLGYGTQQDDERLRISLANHTDTKIEEKLVDYLNFFEFVATLRQLRQLSIREIRMMFDYYLRQLGDYDFILTYLKDQGFEGLTALVREVRELKKDVE